MLHPVRLNTVISVLIPCRNEAGNVERIFQAIKNLRGIQEVIIIEGGSHDGTYERLASEVEISRDPRIRLLRQSGSGKFNAVLEGVKISKSEHIAIWDGDMTIDYNDQNNLIQLYLSYLPSSQERFVTANRLNPQMGDSAMRPLNKLGNLFFAFATKYVAKINVPDALAGSKIFPRIILDNSEICKKALQLDPFGDLFLLAQVRKHRLRFISINCEYKSRTYGTTNINRWSGGMAMLKFLLHLEAHKCNKPN